MLWLALCLPRLPLEAVPDSPSAEPRAVTEHRRVLACNEAAGRFGVRNGMTQAAAAAMASGMVFRERSTALEAGALAQLAGWAGQFTPAVVIERQGLLLEVQGSIVLFRGLARIAAALREGLRDMGYTAVIAAAPTPAGAWLLALGGVERLIESQPDLLAALGALPVAVLDGGKGVQDGLRAIGVKGIADLLALPRAGLARRFGKALPGLLDRALGKLPDPRPHFVPPERFAAALELPAEVHGADALLFAARRLLLQLEGFLAARAGGVQSLRLTLLHARTATGIELGLVAPGRDAARFTVLLRERLAVTRLAEPVRALRLAAGDILTLSPQSLALFRDEGHGDEGDWRMLVERLAARLGPSAVHGLAAVAEHRPELAWQAAAPAAASQPAAPAAGPRPLWLLERPRQLQQSGSQPRHGGPLRLLSGPERIEAGWWDGHEAARDYFVAMTPQDSVLWIFRERMVAGSEGRWFLHGIFG